VCCRACIEAANPERQRRGLPPIVVHPLAYEPREGSPMDLTNIAAVVPVVGEQTSSGEIATDAKGQPKITVRVYDRDPAVAAQRATTLYDTLRARYAPTSTPEAMP
jgi:hypothetical protein